MKSKIQIFGSIVALSVAFNFLSFFNSDTKGDNFLGSAQLLAQAGSGGNEGCVQDPSARCTLVHESCDPSGCTTSYVNFTQMRKFTW